MKLFIKTKTRAKEKRVVKKSETNFEIHTKEMPIRGKANLDILNQLSDFLKVPKSKLRITGGFASRIKIIEFDK